MARPLAPASPRDVARVDQALYHLKLARDLLTGRATRDKAAESPIAPQMLERVQAAIKSGDGALRHVERRLHASRDRAAGLRHDTGLDDAAGAI